MSKFKKGDVVSCALSGAGVISHEDETVTKVSRGMVYTDGTETPYDAETGVWTGVDYFGFTRRIVAYPSPRPKKRKP